MVGVGLAADAVNLLRGRPSLLALLRTGAFAPIAAVMIGNVVAGVLGEMWNWPADPRWTYKAPYAGRVFLFAMPLPGYLGYAALALDLFALYHLVRPRVRGRALPEAHPLSILGTGR
jgi:MFS family permease